MRSDIHTYTRTYRLLCPSQYNFANSTAGALERIIELYLFGLSLLLLSWITNEN